MDADCSIAWSKTIRGIRDVVDEFASGQEMIRCDLAAVREALDAQQDEY